MRLLCSGVRRFYGSSPLHLLTMLAGFALLGYLLITARPATLWKPEGAWWKSMAVWFAAAIVAHDLVLFPMYSVVDRLFNISAKRRRHQPVVPVRNYLRVPALGSGLLLLIFFPGIVRQGASLYFEDTGLTQQPFLSRWLMLTAAMFAATALVYATRLVTAHLHETNSAESVKK